jgi:hypothetical protein
MTDTAVKPLPPLEVLQSLFSYCPDTGEVRNRCTRGAARAGALAGNAASGDYLRTTVLGQWCRVHRIAYALHHGRDPFPLEIDHINRDRSDNRACNLRAVSPETNKANSDAPYRKVRISYPDGRGTIITSSVTTAARILNRNTGNIHRIANRTNNQIYYPHPSLPHTYIPSGIYVSYV